MARTYTCERHVIERAVDRLKDDGLVAAEAWFNHDAPEKLRSEVAYRDFDFLSRLSRIEEAETVRSILTWLSGAGVVPKDATYDEGAFAALRRAVKDSFDVPGSSITPVMARLLYALSSVQKPQRAIGLGTYCGYALVWAVGASCGPGRVYDAEKVYGIDVDAAATERARANLGRLAHTGHVELLAEDGLEVVERLTGPFDYVYLDVEGKDLGKGLYLALLERLYEKIEVGGWVLAHDTMVPPFAAQLEEYLALVRNEDKFRESISFDVDPFGLELSIR